jgi:uncharacterized protein (DUF1697 family)
LTRIAGHEPFSTEALDEGWRLYVAFVRNAPSPEAARKLLSLRSEIDDFQLRGREVYWLRRKGSLADHPGPPIEKLFGAPATVRNVTTVRKIAAKYCGG